MKVAKAMAKAVRAPDWQVSSVCDGFVLEVDCNSGARRRVYRDGRIEPISTGEADTPRLKVLSIRQPWAHLIIHGGKDVENRTWATKHRGRFLVQASKGLTGPEYWAVCSWLSERRLPAPPSLKELQLGGIIGSVELVDCQPSSASPWYMGEVAFVLANPVALPFTECKGRLGFFDAPDDILAKLEGFL